MKRFCVTSMKEKDDCENVINSKLLLPADNELRKNVSIRKSFFFYVKRISNNIFKLENLFDVVVDALVSSSCTCSHSSHADDVSVGSQSVNREKKNFFVLYDKWTRPHSMTFRA